VVTQTNEDEKHPRVVRAKPIVSSQSTNKGTVLDYGTMSGESAQSRHGEKLTKLSRSVDPGPKASLLRGQKELTDRSVAQNNLVESSQSNEDLEEVDLYVELSPIRFKPSQVPASKFIPTPADLKYSKLNAI